MHVTHVLTLIIGVSIILLRNINPSRLCNGTSLSVKKMMNNIIEATILKGKFKGENVQLSHIPMIPTDMPFEFKPFAVSDATRICNDKALQIATSVWTKFGKSILFIWTAVCGLLKRRKTF
ncbi:hypothetical protein PR048_026635 [Dryococelus australis]|uniref:DNA helicase Pif1-like 2B domain-containing protein n=1 Tax=Dryococelus australis TaxID=614101 RepID=A0ABQ9GLW1_9NEOP|nr:hypothetical protein PR048_026635 [Dryococelus australis]